MPSLTSRVKNAWNAFNNKDPTRFYVDTGPSNYSRPDRVTLSRGSEKSIVQTIYNRIAVDCSAVDIQHVRIDENGAFLYEIDDPLNECLTVSANLDQTPRAFIHDVVLSMLDEGCVAIVPVIADDDPDTNESVKIYSLRVGQIIEWCPYHVKMMVYDEREGRKKPLVMKKESVCLIENPFYAVMNAPNSTLQRLIHKLRMLDKIDENSVSGKLDLIVQLPYSVRATARKNQANERRKEIENQLTGTKYGIAYMDSTEKITQLNRPIENNLLPQIEYLQKDLYSQLGITSGILDGTADDKTKLNYYNQTIEVILSAIVDEMKRKFLTKTARTQLQSIEFFRDPFKMVPVADLAELADKFTRNEILSSNEVRQIIGKKPVDDPKANELRNKNLNPTEGDVPASTDNITQKGGNTVG